MPPLKGSTRIGLFALLLSVIALSLFGSLAAADRALVAADREVVRLDAASAALVAERELRLKSVTLAELFGSLISPTDTTVPPPGFDGIWVLDRTGRIAWRSPDAARMRVDTGALSSLARAGTAETPRARTSVAGASGIILEVPLSHRGAHLGVALGLVSGERLLATLQRETVQRPSLALDAGARRIATLGEPTGSGRKFGSSAAVRFAGDPLSVSVTHRERGQGLRRLLWLLGVIALAALLAGLARERRQAMHLAGRTAELERLYQEVARSNKMKSEFLANISHELRTPLNAIVGFVEMLRDGVYGELSPRQALPVGRIAASATHLRHLVDRLLDIAKIAAGRLEVHAEPVVLRPFVLNVASEMESLVSEQGLALSIGVSPTIPRIRTDQVHLRQILINLIGNACKYTPSGGIQVRARLVGKDAPEVDDPGPPIGVPPDPSHPWVALAVSDTGVGIAPGDIERIFDEFEQVNAGARTDSARRGTGLGLAISRRLARLIGGDLTVVSEPGRGSTFTVWLPVDADQKAAS